MREEKNRNTSVLHPTTTTLPCAFTHLIPPHATATAPCPRSIPQHAMTTIEVEVPRVSVEGAETTGDDGDGDSDDSEH